MEGLLDSGCFGLKSFMLKEDPDWIQNDTTWEMLLMFLQNQKNMVSLTLEENKKSLNHQRTTQILEQLSEQQTEEEPSKLE